MPTKSKCCVWFFSGLCFGLWLLASRGEAGVPVLQCDYNFNGACDAADYAVWRNNLGKDGSHPGNGDGNNIIDRNDYLFWKNGYGLPGTGSIVAGATLNDVPEPNTAILLALAALATLSRYGRSRMV